MSHSQTRNIGADYYPMILKNLNIRLGYFFISLLTLPLLIPIETNAALPVFFADRATCEIDRIRTPETLIPFLRQDSSAFPIHLEADVIDSLEPGMLSLLGNASAVQGAKAVYADRIIFGRENQVVEATGNVVMHSSDGDRITASSLELDLETQIGYADQVFFQQAASGQPIAECIANECLFANKKTTDLTLFEPHAVLRGRAERAYFDGHNRERLENVRLSRCSEGDDSVVLAASEIILDHNTGEAMGRNLSIRFFNTPIFYFPALTFPIADARKTGFLFPSLGFGGDSGVRFVAPYYWNIAPNQDATFTADYMADRGTLLRSEYRYIGAIPTGEFGGRVGAEIITRDKDFGGSRYGASLLHEQQLSEHWRAQLDVGYVSDRDYLDDFGDTLGAESADHVPQVIEAQYENSDQLLVGDDFTFGVLFSDYQIIDPMIDVKDEPYARLPEISLDWSAKFLDDVVESEVESAWTNFDHPVESKITGDRINIRPRVAVNVDKEYGFVRPQVALDLISYNLDEPRTENIRNPGVVVPVVSVDSGLLLERNSFGFGQSWLQPLEPRVFYAFAPYVDQDDQPLFDDEEFDLDSASKYFLPNRFHRTDRVGDTNRISFGLESRLFDAISGKQRLKAGLAQMVYLSQRKVRETPGEAPLTNRYSDLFGEIGVNFTDRLSTSVDVIWNWADGRLSASDVGLDYAGRSSRIELAYRFKPRKSKEDLMAEVTWPLSQRWLLGIENLYSFRESNNLHTAFSLGYDACCWATQLELNHEREENSGEWSGNTGFVFQLQLKDLGGISSSAIDGIVAGLGFD